MLEKLLSELELVPDMQCFIQPEISCSYSVNFRVMFRFTGETKSIFNVWVISTAFLMIASFFPVSFSINMFHFLPPFIFPVLLLCRLKQKGSFQTKLWLLLTQTDLISLQHSFFQFQRRNRIIWFSSRIGAVLQWRWCRCGDIGWTIRRVCLWVQQRYRSGYCLQTRGRWYPG